ncbi:MAG: cysteine--tRNA ligase [Patescibacteria group bacterium]
MHKLRLYNSRSRDKEPFSARGGRVGIYVCGITPYDVTHLGHAFTYTFFDVLGRFLRHSGYRTTYVQNLTDIDDDIIRKAREKKRDWRKLGEENAQKFLDDGAWLGNTPPDIYPRATDHIPDIIMFTEKLLRKGIAYEKNGSVYFEARKDTAFGSLSRLSYRQMLTLANARGNDPRDPNKKDPMDFVLWQKKAPGEPSWDSPWGVKANGFALTGRPGWHIECSAMATRYLGATIDIHGGGGDLLFPHHESEEAQSRAATGRPLARWWMHVGMLRYQGQKMSKSLGNLVLIGDLKKRYTANAVRIYLLSHHYRSSFEYFGRDMQRAKKSDMLFQAVWCAQSGPGKPLITSLHEQRFYHALQDDMNTPKAISALEDLAQRIIKNKNKNSTGAKAFLNIAFSILGLKLSYR